MSAPSPAARAGTDRASAPTAREGGNLAAVVGVLPHWSARDVPGILSFYDPEITWRNRALAEEYRGHGEVAGFLRSLFAAFPDLTFDVARQIASDDLVAEEWVMRGTHRGPFLGVPATGRLIEIRGLSMIEMRDGRFLTDDFCFDAAGVMRQLGLLPSLAAARSRPGLALIGLVVGLQRAGRRLARRPRAAPEEAA